MHFSVWYFYFKTHRFWTPVHVWFCSKCSAEASFQRSMAVSAQAKRQVYLNGIKLCIALFDTLGLLYLCQSFLLRTNVNVVAFLCHSIYFFLCFVMQANVYHATTVKGESRAIKIYKTSILLFKDRDKYVSGEFRWDISFFQAFSHI